MAAQLPPLDRIDPAHAWQPWRPSAADPWGRTWAAHLYRRAAFGASREELVEAERLGPERTLDLLLRGRPEADELRETLEDVGRTAAVSDDEGDQLRGWWLYVIFQGGHPLREKLTLFWHNHFATSIVKVQDPVLMFRQNCLLREHALGRFGPMLQAVSRDGAMLVWLDSNSNVKGRPNENYARELMELFSLGVGHYTEKDVREAARAFTGWHTDGHGFRYNPAVHDTGTKRFLGRTGNWDGGDIVRIILEQPAAARFLVRKLYRAYVSENAEPPDSLLEPLCEAFRKSDYHVAGLLRTMLSSRHFYSAHALHQRLKSPMEFVVGAVQAVYRRYPEKDVDYCPLPQQALVRRIDAVGQRLFAPPNVKGWPGGRAWFNTSTVLERDNFASALASGSLWTDTLSGPRVAAALAPMASAARGDQPETPAPPKALDPARIVQEEFNGAGRSAPSAADLAGVLLNLYVPGGVRPAARAKLVEFLADGRPTGTELAHRVREAVQAILTMPEYQLA